MPAERQHGPDAGPAPQDAELDSYLAALAPESAPGATELTGRFGSAQVFALRLPALRIEQLRRLAEARGVSPGALAVDWVLERLDREDLDDADTGPLPVVADPDTPSWRSALRRRGKP